MNRIGKRAFMLAIMLIALVVLPVMAGADDITDLQQAINEGKSEYTVNTSINVNNVVELTGTLTIYGNGVEDIFTVNLGGELTLGNGIVVNNTNSILYANGGTINIEGAKLNVTGGSSCLGLARDGGIINVKAGTVSSTNEQTTLSASKKTTTGTVNISGGTVESSKTSAVVAKNGATVNISGGTVKSTHKDGANSRCAAYAKDPGSKIVVTGGTVEANGDALSAESGAALDVQDGNIVSHLNEGIDVDNNANVNISGGNITGATKSVVVKGKLVVSGGTFSDDLARAYLKSGMSMEMVNGRWIVAPIVAPIVADLPQTGDNSHLLFFAALLALSGAGMMFMQKKREN